MGGEVEVVVGGGGRGVEVVLVDGKIGTWVLLVLTAGAVSVKVLLADMVSFVDVLTEVMNPEDAVGSGVGRVGGGGDVYPG